MNSYDNVYSEEINDWKDFQNKISDFFNEIGFKASVETIISGARGSFESDVYAEKDSNPKLRILFECKYWNTNIPQDVVFSFLQRVDNCGANLGYIVSKKGFQEGAIEAVKKTNVELYQFQDFFSLYYNDWINNQLDKVRQQLSFLSDTIYDHLFECTNRILNNDSGFYAESQKKEFIDITDFYNYLFIIHDNQKGGNVINAKTYSDDLFLNFIPQNVKLLRGEEETFIVKNLGEAFRLILNTSLIQNLKNEINNFLNKSKAGHFKDD